MAKGQKKSNREVRKPKKEKVAPVPEATFGSQVKLAATGKEKGTKPKH
ncbi:MAG: hypothetical protein RLZZ444_583 [Pseudomonadota bacterium]|jgi:hypothetical protein